MKTINQLQQKLKLKSFQLRYRLWELRPWNKKYVTQAEKGVMPHVNDCRFWFWFGWVWLFGSLIGELAFSEMEDYTSKAGAILVAAGVLLELNIRYIRISIDRINNGTVSPDGTFTADNIAGMFQKEWTNEKVNGVPVSMWLNARENDIFKFKANAFWSITIGTIIWAYGDVFI